MQQRRKGGVLAAARAPLVAMKQAGVAAARKSGANLSAAAAILSLFIVASFIFYSDDVRRLTSVFPFTPARLADVGASGRAAELEAAARAFQERRERSEEEMIRVIDGPGTPSTPELDEVGRAEQQRDVQLPAAAGGGVGGGGGRERTVLSLSAAAVAGGAALQAGCDVYEGSWVYDAVSYPIYKEDECEFLTEQVTCMRNGRRDDAHQRWRWQPKACNLPRFDARLMLEKLRGKRLMFVGDSLNRNQWESMVCLVQAVVPKGKKTLTKFVNDGPTNVFRAEEYNATVEFYWAPFLVESNSDDPKVHSVPNRIIMPESILKHADGWRGVDYLIFNTYIWWLNTLAMKILKGSFAQGSTEYYEVDRPVAYRRVLNSWAQWVDANIDPRKTTVFFMSMSPNHITPDAWGNPGGIKCAMETLPIMNLTWQLDIGTDWRLYEVAKEVIASMRRVPVHFIDITAMSELRKDAHTSVHTLRQGKLLTPEQQANPKRFADCIHWCLPGLPDVWNEFLFMHIAVNSQAQ